MQHRPTETHETAALRELAEGRPFAGLCLAQARDGQSEYQVACAAMQILMRWIDEELLAA